MKDRKTNRQKTVAALLVAVLAAGAGYVFWKSTRRVSHPVGDAGKCANNLRWISEACFLYSRQHNGRFPPTLSAVLGKDVDNYTFLCPACSTEPPPNAPANWIDTHSNYTYLGAGLDLSNARDLGAPSQTTDG